MRFPPCSSLYSDLQELSSFWGYPICELFDWKQTIFIQWG